MRNRTNASNAAFWREAARSLPPHVQARYAGYFERAQVWELALDGAIALGARLKQRLHRRPQTQAA